MPQSSQPQSTLQQLQRVDQVQLVRDRFTNGASPNQVAGIAMLLQQMEAQTSNPDAEVSIRTSYGPLQLCATFRRGEWIGHDFTQRLSDPRISQEFGHPNAPMHLDRSLYLYPRQREQSLSIPAQQPQPQIQPQPQQVQPQPQFIAGPSTQNIPPLMSQIALLPNTFLPVTGPSSI